MSLDDFTLDEERSAYSPANQTAQLIKKRLEATSVAIYERWRNEESFHLTGCIGPEDGVQGPASELRRPELADNAPWIGLTSFVGFFKQTLRISSSRDGATVTVDGKAMRVEMDFGARELIDPGPFLGVPIVSGAETLGVIRVVRGKSDNRPFTDEDERRLIWVSRFLALSFIQERMRVELIDGLMSIATCDSEDEALERIAAEAQRLLNHPSAVFLRESLRAEAPDRYVFRAPSAIAHQIDQKEYTRDSGGYTSLVLFERWPHVLSPNLEVDTQEGGPLQNVRHESKSTETGLGQAKSFVAVPIPGEEEARPLGVIRASSLNPYAFSRRDVETLRALARQATVVLRRLAGMRERQAFFQTIVDTSPRPILAIETEGTIVAYNDTMAALLGKPKDEAVGKPLLKIAFAGRRKLAKANALALESANGKLQGHYTTVYRECPQGYLTIPVRIDASYLRSASTNEPTGVVAYFTDLRGPGADTTITSVGKSDEELRTVDLATAREVLRLKEELKGDAELHVLITGETGSGKELLARAAAEALDRPECRPINCAGLTDSVLESELFGAEGGIATDVPEHVGIFDPEFRGTVILDEIQELSPLVQAKLLRVLDTGKVRPMGAKQEKELGDNIRVVALTNADLDAMVAEGRFRGDLRFRLHGFRFHLNPLRDRRADIMQLADHFVTLQRQKRGGGPQGFSSNAIRALLAHNWPGNVRELRKAVELAFNRAILNKAAPLVIPLDCLPEQIREVGTDVGAPEARGEAVNGDLTSRVTGLDELVGALVERVKKLEQQGGTGDAGSFGGVLKEALSKDPALRTRLKEGGFKTLEKFFAERGLSPKRTTVFALLKTIGDPSPDSDPPDSQSEALPKPVRDRTDRN